MALARFRFPDSSPSYTPEFPQGAALNHEPTALPLSYRGPYARFYGMNRSPITLDPTRPKWTYSFPRDSSNDRRRSFPLFGRTGSATISHVLERPTHRRLPTFFALSGLAA